MPIAVITGAATGVGFETVAAIVQQCPDFEIVAITHTENKNSELQLFASKHATVRCLAWDIVSGESEPLLSVVHEKPIELLINNAGLLVKKPFLDLGYEDFLKAWQVNCWGAARVTQLLLPNLLKATHPHVVMIGSMGGFSGSVKFSELAAYSSAKGAVSILTEALHHEFLHTNLTFNCLSFGAIQTNMLSRAFPGYRAPITAAAAGSFIAHFALTGYRYFRGKVLPVSTTTP